MATTAAPTLRSIEDAAARLHALADALARNNEVEFERGGLRFKVHVPDQVDFKLEIEIDNLCYEILALDQPVARDLRFIATALKIVRDIERIGDTAVNIAERARELIAEPEIKRAFER